MLVRAKSDLPVHPGALAVPDAVEASTIRASGVEALLERLAREVELRAGAAGDEGGIVASLRQLELIDSLASVLAAGGAPPADRPPPAGPVDLKAALDHTGGISGGAVGARVLRRILSTFRLGQGRRP